MSDKPESRDLSGYLDDEFAAFTDRLLSGDQSGNKEMFAQDQELRELQETAVRIRRAFEAVDPSRAMAERIRDNLVAEWRESGLGEGPAPFWKRWMRSDSQSSRASIAGRRPVYALAMAASIILLGILVSFLIPTVAPSLTGGAGADGSMVWLILVLGVVAAGIVWWGARHRR